MGVISRRRSVMTRTLKRVLISGASRAPQVVLGTFGRPKLEVLGIVRVITETLNPR